MKKTAGKAAALMAVHSGEGAVSFIDALNDMGRVFENTPRLDGKSFKFEPLALLA
ncbi:MAG: hypothetical protein ACK502_07670 [Alphaproteobacteria bacterium]